MVWVLQTQKIFRPLGVPFGLWVNCYLEIMFIKSFHALTTSFPPLMKGIGSGSAYLHKMMLTVSCDNVLLPRKCFLWNSSNFAHGGVDRSYVPRLAYAMNVLAVRIVKQGTETAMLRTGFAI